MIGNFTQNNFRIGTDHHGGSFITYV